MEPEPVRQFVSKAARCNARAAFELCRTILRGCELTAMEDVRLPADVEAAPRPTAPVGSPAPTTAQPGPSTSVRTIPGCGIPAPPRWRQWRGPAAAAAPP